MRVVIRVRVGKRIGIIWVWGRGERKRMRRVCEWREHDWWVRVWSRVGVHGG